MVISFLQRHPKVAAGSILPEENLGVMLIEILELYGTRLNYDRVGISVDKGGYYFDKLELQSVNQRVWKQICIRDPNDFTNNIAKASHQVDNIIKVFADAFREITTRCYVLHGRIRTGEKVTWGTTSGSILDSIIYPPESGVRQSSRRPATGISASKPGPSPSTAKIPSRRERREQERLRKEASLKKSSENKSSIDVSKSGIAGKAPVPKGGTAAVGGSRDAEIIIEDSSEPPTSPLVSSEALLTSNKNKKVKN